MSGTRRDAQSFFTIRSTVGDFEDEVLPPPVTRAGWVYEAAAILAQRYGCDAIIDLGCGDGSHLGALKNSDLKVKGIDSSSEIAAIKSLNGPGDWIAWDEASPELLSDHELASLDPDRAVIVCSDTLHRFADPTKALHLVSRLLQAAPVALVATGGPSEEAASGSPLRHRWDVEGLTSLCSWSQLKVRFAGNGPATMAAHQAVVIAENDRALDPVVAPDRFRVLAVMTAYNEGDIIRHAIESLISEGVDVYLLDNWSTDHTVLEAKRCLGNGLVAIERYPGTGPSSIYDWQGLLERVADISTKWGADWTIHQDADEIRSSPWPGVSLRDGLYHVDRSGFSAVDHSVIVFPPIDDGFVPGTNFERYLSHFRFGMQPSDFVQIKAWKNVGLKPAPYDGGHDFRFLGRRVYPFRFLSKHYPIRSQSHGEQKVLRDRQPRWVSTEREMGWHTQYDDVDESHSFIAAKEDLELFEQSEFNRRFLLERLFRIHPND